MSASATQGGHKKKKKKKETTAAKYNGLPCWAAITSSVQRELTTYTV